jgi:hypothetical protein
MMKHKVGFFKEMTFGEIFIQKATVKLGHEQLL